MSLVQLVSQLFCPLAKGKRTKLKADPGKYWAFLETPLSLIISASDPLVKIYLRCRHGQTVKNGASSHETNYNYIFFRDSKS